MTREEAIQTLTTIDSGYSPNFVANGHIAMGMAIKALEQEPKTGHCKDCKYFEYDSLAIVDGIPLIVAHEICSRWSDGCKTNENGYCFLFEPQESEVSDADSN